MHGKEWRKKGQLRVRRVKGIENSGKEKGHGREELLLGKGRSRERGVG